MVVKSYNLPELSLQAALTQAKRQEALVEKEADAWI